MRSQRSPGERHGKDEDGSGNQKFSELPRTTSPFYHLPNFSNDDQEDSEDVVFANSDQFQMPDHHKTTDRGPLAARYNN